MDDLGRYSHRTALTDGRPLGFDGERVELAYKDDRGGDWRKVMTLDAEELLRRFLLHVLPPGFMRIRHFGFLANRCRRRGLAQVRAALAAAPPRDNGADKGAPAAPATLPCPRCKTGRLRPVDMLPPRPATRGPTRLEGG